MKCLVVIFAVLQAVFAGQVSVQGPYLNPADVTYVPGAAAPFAATTSYAAAAPYPAAASYAAAAPISNAYTTSTYYGNGHFLGRLPASSFAAAPVAATHVPAVHHIQAVATPAAAVVPTVHHLPAIANVPVTRFQAQPGFIQKEIDVAKPAVKINKFELRRPAIQKQFYDIEERVVVRPAGSALLELGQSHSKIHKSSVVSFVAPAHATPAHIAPAVIASSPTGFVPIQQGFGISSTPNPFEEEIAADDDSVVIEARRLSQSQQQSQPQQPQPQQQEYQVESRVQQQASQRTSLPLPSSPAQPENQRSTYTQALIRSLPQTRQEQSDNQQKLIELLTSREGIADVGFNSPSFRNVGDAGTIRARVLSAQIAPKNAPVTGERVNTRRVVVSRPIETVEEVDVLEPISKLERVAVQHPAVFKSAHIGYERVPTSVPVLGKAIAPLVAKTVTPALYSHAPFYYH